MSDSHKQVDLSTGSLPEMLETRRVVEMIKNANLYELINISLRQNELQSETVELFIQRALEGKRILPAELEQENEERSASVRESIDIKSESDVEYVSLQGSLQKQNTPQEHGVTDENLRHSPVKDHQYSSQQSSGKPFRELIALQSSILENSPEKSQVLNVKPQQFQYESFSNFTFIIDQKPQSSENAQHFLKPINETSLAEMITRPQHQPSQSKISEKSMDENSNNNTIRIHHSGVFDNELYGDCDFEQHQTSDKVLATINGLPCKLQTEVTPVTEQFSFYKSNPKESKKQSPEKQSPTLKFQPIKESYVSNYVIRPYKVPMNVQKTPDRGQRTPGSRSPMPRFAHQTESSCFKQNSSVLRMSYISKSPSGRNITDINFKSPNRTTAFVTNSRTSEQPQISTRNGSKSPAGTNKTCGFSFNSTVGHSSKGEDSGRQQADHIQKLRNLKYNVEVKKSIMLDSFNIMTVQSFIDLERIKRPSSIALSTGKLVCRFFSIFKDTGKLLQPNFIEALTSDWVHMQKYIHGFVTMQSSTDFFNNIRTKVLQIPNMKIEKREAFQTIILQIKKDFFSGDNIKQFKHIETSKNLSTIVHFILKVVHYIFEHYLLEKHIRFQAPQQLEGEDSDRFSNDLAKSSSFEALTITRKIQVQSTLNSQNLKRNISPLPDQKSKYFQRSVSPLPMRKAQNDSVVSKITITRDRSQILANRTSTQNESRQKLFMVEKNKKQQLREVKNIAVLPHQVVKGHRSLFESILSDKEADLNQDYYLQNCFSKKEIEQEEARLKSMMLSSINSTLILENSMTKLNQELMIQVSSSALQELIQKQSEKILQNMKSQSNVDMTIIEQLKMRRKVQQINQSDDDLSPALARCNKSQLRKPPSQ